MSRRATPTELAVLNLARNAQVAEIAAQGLGSDQLRNLNPTQIEPLIDELRRGESSLRKLRNRLQALQVGVDRTCARDGCTRPMAGRADARYCSAGCRLIVHRARRPAGDA